MALIAYLHQSLSHFGCRGVTEVTDKKKPGCSAKLLLSWMHGDIMVMLEKNVDSKTSSIILAIPATVLPKVSVSNNMTQFNNDLAIEEFHEEIRARLEMGTIW